MDTINTILYILHVLSVVAILVLLLLQWNKEPRKLNPGILHAGLTALISGLAMVGIFSTVQLEEDLNHTKVGVKLLILIAILLISYRNVKKPILAKNTWLALIGLTIANILTASLW